MRQRWSLSRIDDGGGRGGRSARVCGVSAMERMERTKDERTRVSDDVRWYVCARVPLESG